MFARGVDPSDPARRRTLLYALAVTITIIAGVYTVLAVGMMTKIYIPTRIATPYENAEWKALKKAFAENPEDEQIVADLRALDKKLRIEFHRGRETLWIGRWLITIGAIAFLGAALIVSEIHRTPNMPRPIEDMEEFQERRRAAARWLVSIMSLVVGVGGGMIAVYWQVEPLPVATADAAAKKKKGPAPPPTQAEIDKQWGTWRGPNGGGVANHTDVPLEFDGKMGKNIIWRSPVPVPGKNSPVVWGNRVFTAGATKKVREVFAFNTDGGKLIWRKKVSPPNPDGRPPEVLKDTGYAAATQATDGRYVCSIFANGDISCHDMDGKEVWARNLGLPDNQYGHSASLALYQELVIVQLDQSTRDAGKSALLGLSLKDGKTKYKVKRPVMESWSSPILIYHEGKPQLITCANPYVISYDPGTGKELWRFDCLEGDGGPSPIYAHGTVYAANIDSFLSAIVPSATGELKEDSKEVLWQGEDGLPDICSPVATEELVFTLAGFLTCIDAKTGEMLWEHDFDTGFNASPTLIGDKIMVIEKSGKVHYVAASRELKILDIKATLGEPCDSSPAFAPGRIYLRGKKYLYCIGKP